MCAVFYAAAARRRSLQRAALLLALPLLLGGCTDLAVGTFDTKLSQITDAKCSYAHVLVGDSYCQSRTVATAATPLYCFRSLGRVDCYDTPDPYAINGSGRALEPPLVAPVDPPETAPPSS